MNDIEIKRVAKRESRTCGENQLQSHQIQIFFWPEKKMRERKMVGRSERDAGTTFGCNENLPKQKLPNEQLPNEELAIS